MYKAKLEFLEKVIILAKKHKVDVIKVDNVEILITRHESEYETREDPKASPITDKPLTEEQLLFYSSDEEDV